LNEKRFKVSKEEYLLLQQAKQRDTELGKEQRVYDRDWQLKLNEVKIKQFERQIINKKAQISSKQIIEKHDGFIGDKKPEYWLQNEIDQIELEIEKLQDSNKKIKQEQEKDIEVRKDG